MWCPVGPTLGRHSGCLNRPSSLPEYRRRDIVEEYGIGTPRTTTPDNYMATLAPVGECNAVTYTRLPGERARCDRRLSASGRHEPTPFFCTRIEPGLACSN